jgi:hypothetical protein
MMPEPEDLQRGDTWDGNTGVRRHKRGRGRAGRRRPGRGLLLLTMALVLATLAAVIATAPDDHGPNTAVGLPRVPSPGQHPDGTPADLAPTDPPPTTSVSTGPMPVATAESPRTRPGSAQPPAKAQAPAKTTDPVPGPTAIASATPAFVPIGVEAEDPDNLISGGATVVECGPCAGGRRVGYIGAGARVVVVANLFSAGTRTLTVT